MSIALPEDMDVPEMRKDTTNKGNVHWLLRNLFVRNGNHPKFKEIIEKLKQER